MPSCPMLILQDNYSCWHTVPNVVKLTHSSGKAVEKCPLMNRALHRA